MPILGCSSTRSVKATKLIRRMRGGSQSILLEADDGKRYVTKMSSNAQGPNLLANEWIGTMLARAIGLPVASAGFIELSASFIEQHPDVSYDTKDRTILPVPGLHFGSMMVDEYSGLGRLIQFVPSSQHHMIKDLPLYVGMALFDILVEHCDDRQAVYHRSFETGKLATTFIDFGHIFGGPNWDLSHQRYISRHYERSRCPLLWRTQTVDRWLVRFQRVIPELLPLCLVDMPSSWYAGDLVSLQKRLQHNVEQLPILIKDHFSVHANVKTPFKGQHSKAEVTA